MIFTGGEQGFQKNDGRHTADRVYTDQQGFPPAFRVQQAVPIAFRGQQVPEMFAGQQWGPLRSEIGSHSGGS